MTGSEGSRSSHADELQASRIRQLNDQFRTRFTGGKVMITRGIEALGPLAVLGIMDEVRAFQNFHDDNDPHGEHDFGAFEWCSDTIFWKIDLYDPGLVKFALNGSFC